LVARPNTTLHERRKLPKSGASQDELTPIS